MSSESRNSLMSCPDGESNRGYFDFTAQCYSDAKIGIAVFSAIQLLMYLIILVPVCTFYGRRIFNGCKGEFFGTQHVVMALILLRALCEIPLNLIVLITGETLADRTTYFTILVFFSYAANPAIQAAIAYAFVQVQSDLAKRLVGTELPMNLIRFYLISVSIISTLGSAFILFGSLIVEFPLHMAIFIGNIVILVILTPPSIISAHTVRKRISTLSNDPTTKNYAKIKNATSKLQRFVVTSAASIPPQLIIWIITLTVPWFRDHEWIPWSFMILRTLPELLGAFLFGFRKPITSSARSSDVKRMASNPNEGMLGPVAALTFGPSHKTPADALDSERSRNFSQRDLDTSANAAPSPELTKKQKTPPQTNETQITKVSTSETQTSQQQTQEDLEKKEEVSIQVNEPKTIESDENAAQSIELSQV